MDYLLEIDDLHTYFKTKKGTVKAVNGVSYRVEAGKTLGIVGESGSGKSVSAMSILKLLDGNGYIDSGEIKFKGRNLVECSQNVKIPNAKSIMKQYPHQLSGGMRQRVMIAMALACEPSLLIADEPTTALDVTIQAQILHLMNELKREKGTSILFITHDLGVINEMADSVAVMYCGQVVEMCDAHTIFARDNEYSHPYTEGLMTSIPRLDTPVGTRLDAIPGSVPHPLDLPKGCKFAPRCKYATAKCMEEEPKLEEVEGNHSVRCFYPEKEGRHATK